VTDQAVNRIFPRNLTAQAAYNVPGNPPSTRPESGVANCYPGLEYDHRNLDRRFFPGLIVEYASQDDATDPNQSRRGARVVAVDLSDTEIGQPPAGLAPLVRPLAQALTRLSPNLTAQRLWFLAAATQDGTTIHFVDEEGAPLDGLIVWRLVRSLRPGAVTLRVQERVTGSDPPPPVELEGWRRFYTDARTGVIDLSFQPGELTQSLCSPWQHDFRDCSCTYWASNHPDIVFPPIAPGEATLAGGMPADPTGETRIDWLRDPDFSELHATALPSQGANRPFQISYYQINHQWEDLAVVLEGREVDGTYVSRSRARDWAVPFDSLEEMWQRIVALAGLEHLVALLYLYALFSVRDADEAAEQQRWPMLADDVTFTRSVLLEVATGEMQHLRWANLLLWGLAEATGHPYQPAVVPPALSLPDPSGGSSRPAVLAPLTPDTLQLFVDIERGSAFIDGQYARVTATLRQPTYPKHLYQLASNVAEDGEQHFLHFRDMQRVLRPYGSEQPAYLRAVMPADPAQPDVAAALGVYRQITDLLITGYQFGDRQNQRALAEARALMFDLQARAEALAKQGHGLPFLSVWR
jgi:hypothetical protein